MMTNSNLQSLEFQSPGALENGKPLNHVILKYQHSQPTGNIS